MDINNVILIGRLTKDPELNQTSTGTNICKFSLAVNGYKKDDVSFFDVITWNKLAETVNTYVGKGSRVCVSGTLRQERWEKDGKKFSKVVVNANTVQFLDAKKIDSKQAIINQEIVNNTFNSDEIPY